MRIQTQGSSPAPSSRNLEAVGVVTFNERSATALFERFVQDEVRRWLEDRDEASPPLTYEIAFFDEDSLNEVSCLVAINAQGQLMRSWETADNPRMALKRSLERLEF